MAAGNFAVASSNKYISCTCRWSSTVNTNGNYSTVNFELRASRTNSGYTTYGTGSGGVTINGTAVTFSITSSQKITQNSNTLLGSGSVVVYHNDDGAKSITISAYASIPGASLTLGTTSASITLDTIARASTPTLNGTVFTITEANSNYMRIYTNRKSSSFSHHVYYSFNGSSEIGLANSVGDYYDWYFPSTLANHIPNATSGTGYIRLYTFNGGTNIGSNTIPFTLQVGDEFVPSVTFEISDAKGYFEQYGKYIQGNSKITGNIVGKGCYGSTIKSCKTTVDGKTYSDFEFTTDAIVNAGTQIISVSITDSRGKTVNIEQEIEIYEYKPPKITAVMAKRCTEDGASSLKGDYLSCIFSSEVTSLDNQNPVTYSVEYKGISESSYETVLLNDFKNQHKVVDGNYIFAVEKEAYSIILIVSDGFGQVQKKAVGPSVSVLFSRLWKGLGYAVGKFAELEGVFDIGFKTRFSGGILYSVLEEATDLNEVLTPNVYAGRDVATAGYLNVPMDYTDGKFMLNIVSCGDNEELKQTFTTCSKENPQVYVRFYYDGEWGEWRNEYAKLADLVYPIGSIYMSINSTNPSELFGGEWETWCSGRVPIGVYNQDSDFNAAEKYGGSKTVTLTTGQIPSHSHTIPMHSSGTEATGYGLAMGNVGFGNRVIVDTQTGYSPIVTYTGGSGAHNNLPPYLTCYMWKRIA